MILTPNNASRQGETYRVELGPLPDAEEVAALSIKYYNAASRARRKPTRAVLADSKLTGARAKALMKCVKRYVTAETLKEGTPNLARRKMGAGANGAAVALAACHPGKTGTRAPKLAAESWVVVKGGGEDGKRPLNLPLEAEDGVKVTEAARGKTPHVVQTLGVVPSDRVGRGWSVSELLRPMLRPTKTTEGVSTMRHLLSNLGHAGYARVLDAVFQTLWTLAALQNALPGFIHQDLNEDNIMLTPGDGRAHTYVLTKRGTGRGIAFKLPAASGSVKLIDFEFASWSRMPRHGRKLRPFAEYGMDARPKAARDMSLFLFVVRAAMQRVDAPAWAALFSRFIEDVLPAKHQVSALRTELDSATPKGNRAIHARRSGVQSPAQALTHAIFAPLRAPPRSGGRSAFRVTVA